MALHTLASVTVGVPNLTETFDYYVEFGLTSSDDGWLSSVDGGRQMRIVSAPMRRLIGFTIGVDDEDDLGRAAERLSRLNVAHQRIEDKLISADPVTAAVVTLQIRPRLQQPVFEPTPYNSNGRLDRIGNRAPGIMREHRVRPRRLGHIVLGSDDYEVSSSFFVDGIGFKVSDLVKGAGAFLRCTTDHHNLLLLRAPVSFLHHTGWQVEDLDEVGRGAMAMLEGHPERHVWGLGRHHVGSNFFWYLKDPAGNFTEYYSDTDCIVDDQLWKPEVFEGMHGLYNWGPPPPRSFIQPDDLAALMMGAHKAS
ncbi:MAG TPA: VOC family protein [Pseudonocardiaceae bacterium]